LYTLAPRSALIESGFIGVEVVFIFESAIIMWDESAIIMWDVSAIIMWLEVSGVEVEVAGCSPFLHPAKRDDGKDEYDALIRTP
jgi:hypothetical protein